MIIDKGPGTGTKDQGQGQGPLLGEGSTDIRCRFADEKLAVGADLAPKPAMVEADAASDAAAVASAVNSAGATPAEPAMDLAEMVAQAAREAEAWADEEEALVMDEQGEEGCKFVALRSIHFLWYTALLKFLGAN